MTRKTAPNLHVVLYEPQIPWNTGNAARTCLAMGARLHLIEPLGFSLDAKAVRRAGLDYWSHVDLKLYSGWDLFLKANSHLGDPWLMTTRGAGTLYGAHFSPPEVFVFGSETSGLPDFIHAAFPGRGLRIPQVPGVVRSLNLSTSVGIVSGEFRRRFPLDGATST